MKNLICIQMLFLLVMLIPTGILSAETLATKLEIFSTKIKSEQAHFPKGDLADITYVKKIITQMYNNE